MLLQNKLPNKMLLLKLSQVGALDICYNNMGVEKIKVLRQESQSVLILILRR